MSNAVTNPGSAVALVDSPLAKDLILEGSPSPRIWVNAQSPDKKVTHGVWDCTAGRFNWEFTCDEFVMILDGEVTITPENGDAFTLRTGDLCYFPAGLKTLWQVDRYVKKTFTLRTAEPLEL
ncbi:MAG: cupin domain-containing protein [Candidatus Latescibacterota bacterium]